MRRLCDFLVDNVLRWPILGVLYTVQWLGTALDYILTPLINYTCQIAENLVRITFGVTYLLGVTCTTTLLALAMPLLVYTVLIEFGLSMPQIQVYYEIATRIAENKLFWPATTIIVAITVALAHLKNLNVNRARHLAEMRDRWKAEEEERRKRREEPNRLPRYPGVMSYAGLYPLGKRRSDYDLQRLTISHFHRGSQQGSVDNSAYDLKRFDLSRFRPGSQQDPVDNVCDSYPRQRCNEPD